MEILKENGFKVYGADVTGPVKALLKLQEEETFRTVKVGEFDYWNWESKKIACKRKSLSKKRKWPFLL